MAKTTTAPITQSIKNTGVVFNSSSLLTAFTTGTSAVNTVALVTAGVEGSIVKSVRVASSDSAARYLTFWLDYLGTNATMYLLGTIPIPITAGGSATGAVINVDVLGHPMLTGLSLDQTNKPILELAPSAILRVGIIAATTASTFIWVTAESEDF